MKSVKTYTLIFGLAIILFGCQDVIEINLDSIEPRLVIDGSITDIDTTLVVKLTKSGDYFDPETYPNVSGSTVTITDDLGYVSQLLETAPGIYSVNRTGEEGRSYTMKVESEGEIYNATVEVPYKVAIDSVSFEPTPAYMEFSGGYIINCHLHDPANIENYYRLKVYNIDDPAGASQSLKLFDDAFTDGHDVVLQWDVEQFIPLNRVVVELQTLDKSTYDYYFALSSLFEGGMIGNANPSNPITNISNGALGYFGAYTVSRDTVLIFP
ncbi:DUF4249 domain-containing protein [Saccharicrinis sp. FJH2]|uniref:DUF4249 domain-containing protein n=1 Tax=Saccharicrinis sp. FJH65 TaxID=3344659 RepID=UPI0035F45B64